MHSNFRSAVPSKTDNVPKLFEKKKTFFSFLTSLLQNIFRSIKDQYISIEHDNILFLNQLHVLDCNKAIIILRTGITNTKLTTVIICKLRPQLVTRISIILNF